MNQSVNECACWCAQCQLYRPLSMKQIDAESKAISNWACAACVRSEIQTQLESISNVFQKEQTRAHFVWSDHVEDAAKLIWMRNGCAERVISLRRRLDLLRNQYQQLMKQQRSAEKAMRGRRQQITRVMQSLRDLYQPKIYECREKQNKLHVEGQRSRGHVHAARQSLVNQVCRNLFFFEWSILENSQENTVNIDVLSNQNVPIVRRFLHPATNSSILPISQFLKKERPSSTERYYLNGMIEMTCMFSKILEDYLDPRDRLVPPVITYHHARPFVRVGSSWLPLIRSRSQQQRKPSSLLHSDQQQGQSSYEMPVEDSSASSWTGGSGDGELWWRLAMTVWSYYLGLPECSEGMNFENADFLQQTAPSSLLSHPWNLLARRCHDLLVLSPEHSSRVMPLPNYLALSLIRDQTWHAIWKVFQKQSWTLGNSSPFMQFLNGLLTHEGPSLTELQHYMQNSFLNKRSTSSSEFGLKQEEEWLCEEDLEKEGPDDQEEEGWALVDQEST